MKVDGVVQPYNFIPLIDDRRDHSVEVRYGRRYIRDAFGLG